MRGNLQGTPLKDKAGNVVGWRVRVAVTTATGGKRTKGFERKTLRAAQDAATAYLGEHGRILPEATPGTVREAVEATKADLWSSLAPHTLRNYSSYADRLADEFGDRPASEITPPQITAYLKRYSGLSKRTMDEHHKVARAVFGYAASDLGWVGANPVDLARKPRSTGKGMEWPPLTRADLDLVLPRLPEPYRLLYRLLAETGARPSEAWGLDVRERLDFAGDVWWFVVRKGKTEASTRRVPIPDALARDLEAAGPVPFAGVAALRQPAKHLRDVWEAAMAAAGLPYTRPYEVRAMRINEWRRMAIPGAVRRTMAGHTSERTTNDWYDRIDAGEVLKALGVGAIGAEEEDA